MLLFQMRPTCFDCNPETTALKLIYQSLMFSYLSFNLNFNTESEETHLTIIKHSLIKREGWLVQESGESLHLYYLYLSSRSQQFIMHSDFKQLCFYLRNSKSFFEFCEVGRDQTK